MLEGGPSHEADEVSGYYDIEMPKGSHPNSREIRNDEGEVEASTTIRETRNLDPHMLMEREAMVVHRSFS